MRRRPRLPVPDSVGGLGVRLTVHGQHAARCEVVGHARPPPPSPSARGALGVRAAAALAACAPRGAAPRGTPRGTPRRAPLGALARALPAPALASARAPTRTARGALGASAPAPVRASPALSVGRVHDLDGRTEHRVVAGGVLLLVVVADVHDVPARARPPAPLRLSAVTREDLDGGHALVGALGLAELDHVDGAAARRPPQDLRARGQRGLLNRRDGNPLLRQYLRSLSQSLGHLRQPPEGPGRVVPIDELNVVVEVGVDELNLHDAARQDKHVAVGHVVAQALPDHLVGVVHGEVPLEGGHDDCAAA
mmetsp:Transcript_25671/g.63263  ORF Transcript_25671/g.63263 Transcript_25671/m.63263 type:complete len:309 (-) Transcript_25671:344-1270(-)